MVFTEYYQSYTLTFICQYRSKWTHCFNFNNALEEIKHFRFYAMLFVSDEAFHGLQQ